MENMRGSFTGNDLKMYLVNQFLDCQRGLERYSDRIWSGKDDQEAAHRMFNEYYGRRQMCLEICREFFYTEFSSAGVDKVIDMIGKDEPVFTFTAMDLIFSLGKKKEA